MSRSAALSWACWLATVGLAAAVLWRGLDFRYDLTLFLPQPQRAEQALLFARLGEGPGSRLLTVAVGGGSADERFRVRDELAAELEGLSAVNQVLTGANEAAGLEPPEPVWSYRYLLADQSFEQAALNRALQQRMGDLSLMGGGELLRLIAADPTLTVVRVLDGLAPVQGAAESGDWSTADGALLVVVETVEPAFAMAAQQSAVDGIRAAFDRAEPPPGMRLEISGAGAFGVELQHTIRDEARWRTGLATGAIVLVLLVAYRRLRPVLVGALPLVTGAVVGLAGVALIFDGVHGITLAFGFTLLGVAIDYPLHLFSHARDRSPRQAIGSVWPTLALGALSTIIAYLALAVGGSAGLAQLGVFTALGVAAAALTTRGILPTLLAGGRAAGVGHTAVQPKLRWWPVMGLAAIGLVAVLWRGPQLWNDNLAALSPVPADRLARDAEFREALGSPDMRHAVAVSGATVAEALNHAQQSVGALAASDAIEGFLSPTQLLPPPAVFEGRRQALPSADVLRRRLFEATASTPFSPDAFAPFVAAVETSRDLPPPTRELYRETPFEQLLDAHLFASGDRWVALISLYRLSDPETLRSRLPSGAMLVDFKTTSESLVADYRQRTFALLGAAALIIALLLWWRFDRPRRVAWVMALVFSAMFSTLGLLLMLFGTLNLYHLIALILVGGLGLDYALFASRCEPKRDRRDTWHALSACVASTASAFGVLALSSIPVLQSLGATVAIGCVIAYGAARAASSAGGEAAGREQPS